MRTLPSGDSVDAGLRVFGQADHDRLGPRPHRTCLGRADEAPWIHEICGARRRLGCAVTDQMGCCRHLRNCSAFTPTCLARFHPTLRRRSRPAARRRPVSQPTRRRAYEQLDFFYKQVGYANEMGTRPQTLYGIADSPVGLAAWMLDHDARSYELIARVFDGQPEGLTRDDILDNITLFWLTNTAVSSARLYWENKCLLSTPKTSPSRLR